MANDREPAVRRVVLFDGVCNFCDAAVHFIIDRDPGKRFEFAALQSSVGTELLARFGKSGLSTMVLIEGERVYTQSSAALRIARQLTGLWPLAYAAIFIPKPLRDFLYSGFASQRYRLFGRLDSCRVPTPELRARFLDLPSSASHS